MNCPFPLPTRFRTTERFNRDIKKVPPKIKTKTALMVSQFANGNPQEEFRPEKLKSTKLFRIRVDEYRVLYELEEENGAFEGILRSIIKRNNDYRELRNR